MMRICCCCWCCCWCCSCCCCSWVVGAHRQSLYYVQNYYFFFSLLENNQNHQTTTFLKALPFPPFPPFPSLLPFPTTTYSLFVTSVTDQQFTETLRAGLTDRNIYSTVRVRPRGTDVSWAARLYSPSFCNQALKPQQRDQLRLRLRLRSTPAY